MIESLKFELFDMNLNDIYERYSYDVVNHLFSSKENSKSKSIKVHLKLIYEPKTLTKFNNIRISPKNMNPAGCTNLS